MERNVRPSGLTAFAIINFIFAGVIGISVMLSVGTLACAGSFSRTQALGPETANISLVTTILNLAVMALLVVSGIGYLKCSPILGRLFGSVYACADAVKTIIALLSLGILQQGSTFIAIITVGNFVWPLLTIVFINFVFNDVWRKRTRLAELASGISSAAAAAPAPAAVPDKKTPPHVVLVMMQSIRQTLRGVQGVLFPLVALVICFTTVGILIAVAQGVQNYAETEGGMNRSQSDRLMRDVVIKQAAYGFFVWLFDDQSQAAPNGPPAKTIAYTPPARDAWADYVTSEKPALLSLIFAVMMTLFPILSSFLAFNQISEDARRKGFRYLLLRTTRSSIFFGKFLAALAIIIPIIVLTVAAVAFFVLISYPFYPVAAVVSWSLWAIVMIFLVSAPSVAFCLLLSALINSGFGSLAAGALTLGFFPLIARLLKDSAGFLVFLQYLLPQKVAYFLMNPRWWVVLLAAVGCVAYVAVYSAGGYFYFKRKSL